MTLKYQTTIEQYKQLPIIKRAVTKLRAELPEQLYYHSIEHTEDVLAESISFALEDELSDREVHLLAVASVYHDFGFLVRYAENEIYGSEFATVAMEESGIYSQSEIDLVAQMILDTGMIETEHGIKSVATSKLSGYLIDADLSNLGRQDFLDKTELIAKERKQSLTQVFPGVLALMQLQAWNSPAAQKCRQEQKKLNLKFVVEQMAKQHNLPS